MAQGRTILYVDDYADNRKLVRRVLEGEGFALIEAADGADALVKLESGAPDLILIDINLPDMNGYALTGKIRAMSPEARIPILAVTAHTRPRDINGPTGAGCDGYIQKPIEVDDLLEQIHRFIPH